MTASENSSSSSSWRTTRWSGEFGAAIGWVRFEIDVCGVDEFLDCGCEVPVQVPTSTSRISIIISIRFIRGFSFLFLSQFLFYRGCDRYDRYNCTLLLY